MTVDKLYASYLYKRDSVIGKGDRHIYPYAWDIPPIVDRYI